MPRPLVHRAASSKAQDRRFRPKLEALEERLAPATFNVSLSGNDTNTGGVADPFRTIQRAIDAAAAAADGQDFVNVEAGIYNAPGVDLNLVIPNSANIDNLLLRGGFDIGSGFTTRTPRTTVYVPQFPGRVIDPDVDIADANVTIDGMYFAFDGVIGVGGARSSAGLVSRAPGLILNDNQLESPSQNLGNDPYAIQTAFGSDQTGLRITNNIINADADSPSGGIYINPGANSGGAGNPILITNNTITGSKLFFWGLAVDSISFVTVSQNSVSRTGTSGLPLIFAGPFKGNANQEGIVLSQNTVDSSDLAGSIGIELGHQNPAFAGNILVNVQLINNVIRDNAFGLFISTNVSGATITGGQITSNGTGTNETPPYIGLLADHIAGLHIVDVVFSGNTVDGRITDAGAITWTVSSGTTTFNGTISGATSLSKLGGGVLVLTGGPNTYTGGTLISGPEGTLVVRTFQPSSDVFVDGGSNLLAGDGTVGNVWVANGGQLSPGTPGPLGPHGAAGRLSSGSATFNGDSSILYVDLNGPVAGAQYDQLKVTGTVSLNGNPGLSVQLGYQPPIGSEFVIIDNDGIDPVMGGGRFNGLAEGDRFIVADAIFQISYRGGDGNDVVLKRVEADTFTFAISAVDLQVYESKVDANTRTSGPWLPTAPGQFREIAVATRRPAPELSRAPMVFGLGVDGQVYFALFRIDGTLQSGWQLMAPGRFDHVALSSFEIVGPDGGKILFAVATAAAGNRQVFAAKFNSNGGFISGWARVAPGAFESIAASTYGGVNPEVFGVGVDHQVYAARLNANGDLINGWFRVAPGGFRALAAAARSDGSLELFGLGLSGPAFGANFNAAGNLAMGWFPLYDNQPTAYVQVVAATLGNGQVTAIGLGSDQHAYQATFAGSGVKLRGWTQLSANVFRFLTAGSQGGNAKLFAVAANDLHVHGLIFDQTGEFNSGFFPLSAGAFLVVGVST